MLLVVALIALCVAADFPLYFQGAKASSTNPGSFDMEYSANNALSSGPEYWCSNAKPNADAVWTGFFSEPNELQSLRINWAYAPQQVKIVASNDRLNFKTLRDWHGSTSPLAAYEETLDFAQPTVVQELRILMRGPLHGYFGITSVLPIANGLPTFMIISGVTTLTDIEYCLIAESIEVGSDIVLDSCAISLSHGDGRDLWQLNPSNQLILANSYPQLCLDKDLILGSCDTVSSLDFKGNGQITLFNTDQCLSINGNSIAMEDIIPSLSPVAECSSVLDIDHAAVNAMSSDLRTFWSSAAFNTPSENHVIYDIEFTTSVKISRVIIDWEYPPLSYSLGVSGDGIEFQTVSETLANPLNVTRDEIGYNGRVLRISMHRLHPDLGKVDNESWVYGIRNIQVLRNPTSLTMEECKDAGTTKDARDKWFRIPVHFFDSTISELSRKSRNIIKSNILSTAKSSEILQQKLQDISQCQDNYHSMDLELISDSLTDLHRRYLDIQDQQAYQHNNPGRSIDSPARSCRSTGLIETGFYWIDSVCQPNPLRMWCDATSPGTYIYNDPTELSDRKYQQDILGLEYLCGSIGLYPIQLKSIQDIKSLFIMLNQQAVEISDNSAIPLAFNLNDQQDSFRELGSMTDVTGLVQRFLGKGAPGPSSTAVGFTSNNELSLIDWRSLQLSGILCSEKSTENQYIAKLDCDSIVAGNRIFQGGINTNFRVGCPSKCQTVAKIYGGQDSVYSDTSIICKAAIHAGLDTREFNLVLETVHENYPSIFRNGIQSHPLKKTRNSIYSIRLGQPFNGCPFNDAIGPMPSPVLIQSDFVSNSNLDLVKIHHTAVQQVTLNPTNQITIAVTNLTLQDTRFAIPIDKNIVDTLKIDLMKMISNGRNLVKPLENLSNKLIAESLHLINKSNRFADQVSKIAKEKLTEIQDISQKIDRDNLRNLAINGFENWEYDDGMQFNDLFEVWNPGQSHWNLVRSIGNYQSTHRILVSGGREGGSEDNFIPISVIRNKRFYDFKFRVNLMIERDGDIAGILFRVQNQYNYYILIIKRLDNSQLEFKVNRVQYGNISLLLKTRISSSDDWIDISIECHRGQISIVANQWNVFNGVDEFITSGSVGFTNIKSNGILAFDISPIKSVCCHDPWIHDPAPIPPKCSYYYDPQYTSSFQHSFNSAHIRHPLNTRLPDTRVRERDAWSNDVADWDYRKGIVGRLQAISITNVPTEIIKMAILNRSSCSNGIISMDISTKNCNGLIGIVYKYRDPDNFSWATLGENDSSIWKRHKGSSLKMLKNNKALKFLDDGSWHNLEIRFNENTINVYYDNEYFYSYKSGTADSQIGSVGIGTSGECELVAIDKFKVQPQGEDESHKSTDLLTCENAANADQRLLVCEDMLPHLKSGNCLANFCSECCEMRHVFTDKNDCIIHCRMNG